MCFHIVLFFLFYNESHRYSTDEGQCWHTYNFSKDPFHFSGLDSEPGSRSMNVSLWGYRNDYSKWVVITIDFKKILSRECKYTLIGVIQWLFSRSWPPAPFNYLRPSLYCTLHATDRHGLSPNH